jgi:predicted dehydrogenase
MLMKKIKFGMIGGGNGAFIGDVHRHGALMDNLAVLTAGCFTRNMERNLETADVWGIADTSRVYANYEEMAEAESAREDGIDFVTIATPNDTHYPIAKCFLEHGIHVVCDKPLTLRVEESEELKKLAEEKGLLFGVTYSFTGYAMIQQARELIDAGEIGEIMTIMAEFPQEWLLVQTVSDHSDQATWRMDPARSGPSSACADIGTHCEALIARMTGLEVTRVLARFERLPKQENLPLENNVQVMMDFSNGASGMLWASEISAGYECEVKIRIFGDRGSVEWCHRNPERLIVTRLNQPPQLYTPKRDYNAPLCNSISRLPTGHPEGFYEAFGNIYRGFCSELLKKKYGIDCPQYPYPKIEDGIRGLKFVYACLESDRRGNVWVDV